MAASLMSARLSQLGRAWRAESAGLGALSGEPADPLAVELLSQRGLDLSRHRARPLTAALACDFELILVMEGSQVRGVEEVFPAARGRVHRLGRFGGFEIPDPYLQSRAAFVASLRLIEQGVEAFARVFWSST